MATTRFATIEDLAEFGDDEQRYEIMRGELVRMSPAGFYHGAIASAVAMHLRLFVVRHQLGQVVTNDSGFILARGPDTMLGPDIAFVRADRLPPIEEQQSFLDLAPDLAVEVVSPSDSAGYVHDKVLEYLRAGVRLVWVIWPIRQTVSVYLPDRTSRELDREEFLDGGDVLPGFELKIAELFG